MQEKPGSHKFQMITFCGAFHYFQDPHAILNRCIQLLSPGGEIHVIDSPFYTDRTQHQAREKSRLYFKQMGQGTLAGYFHHHTLAFLDKYSHQLMYKPSFLKRKLLRQTDSPFLWIKITGHKN
jgi:ubiquinone/menaquinone biosynthesis C-methylase UbiE